MLSVYGTIVATELVIIEDDHSDWEWPDYVFDDGYNLLPLNELEQSIKNNKHLPGIPSAEEVSKNGLIISEMQAKLLQKIEELTLYVIDLKKENDTMKKEIECLKNSK